MSVNSQGSILGPMILNDKDSVIESTLSKYDTKKLIKEKEVLPSKRT